MLGAAVTIVALMIGALVPAGSAQAATVRHAYGNQRAVQNSFTHQVRVHGWAFDPQHRSTPVMVRVYVDGAYRGRTMTNRYSRYINHRHQLHGKHAYTLYLPMSRRAHVVSTRSFGVGSRQHRTLLATHYATHYYPSAGARIIIVARRHVGDRYVYGGASPRPGFDCSGFTMYVYGQAHVARLPHRTDAQMALPRMHIVLARNARAGDLVFYMSGGRPYHVAIYAGHHRQYAAATTRDGVRLQNVWASNVRYGHYR